MAHTYSAAGSGESTTDLAWDGQSAIFENGDDLGEGERFLSGPPYVEVIWETSLALGSYPAHPNTLRS
jgi:hypothetical protein